MAVQRFFQNPVKPSLLPHEPEPLDESSKHFCYAKPTKYDVMLGGRKIAGAAQRRTKAGLLHQGSIGIALPKKEILQDVLLPDTEVVKSMQENTYPILGEGWTKSELNDVRQQLKQALKEIFTNG